MAVTPTQGNVIAAIDLAEIFVSKFTGELNSGGYVNFWQDANRTVPKLVYEQVNNGGSPPTYTYAALPNPIILSGTGNFQDAGGNNVAVYYFPYDTFGNIQQYYIEVFDANNQSQFTREAWPPLWAIQQGSINNTINNIASGRLTLTSGVPVTTTDVTAATTIYYTPYRGNGILLYNNGAWVQYTFGEILSAVPAVASQMYDVFAYPLNNVVTLDLQPWTNDTTRAIPLTTQSGVYVLTGNTSYRYLGSFRTTSSAGHTEDSVANRFVWNYYNRVIKGMTVFDTAVIWSVNNQTLQANSSTANQLNFIIGISEDVVEAQVVWSAQSDAGAVVWAGIGLDSTTTYSPNCYYGATTTTHSGPSGFYCTGSSQYTGYPGIGLHALTWLNSSDKLTGFIGYTANSTFQSGVNGEILC